VALTRDDVVRAAVRLLQDAGLEALTLRRLAGELGVSAPTLYWHVKDKRALLDLVAESIMAAHQPPSSPAHGQPWWEWLRERAWLQYQTLISHRDAALVLAGNRPTAASLPRVEELLASLVEVGFTPDQALETVLILNNYVIGSAVEYQAEAARALATEPDAALAERLRRVEEFPHLSAAVRARSIADWHDSFRRGLDVMLTGLRAWRSEQMAEPAAVRDGVAATQSG
jgi:TetR/AcrR family transcriptional regulator, tetracycline repressor protein